MIFQVAPGVTLLGGPRHAKHGSFSGAFAAAGAGEKNAYGDIPKGDVNVFNLQDALAHLAKVTNHADIDPGILDGVMGPKTRAAVVAGLVVVAPHLPTQAAKTALAGLAVLALAAPATADNLIKQYAPELAVAAGTAAVALLGTGGAGTDDTGAGAGAGGGTTATPWYKTWWGVGGIAVGGLGVVAVFASLLSSPTPRAAPPVAIAGRRY